MSAQARLISLATYARLDEARAALGCSDVAPSSLAIAGGMACRGAQSSWINTALNLGLREGDAGEVSAADADQLTAWYLDAGIDAKVEVSCHAHASLLPLLHSRGYAPTTFETTFVRDITLVERIDAPIPLAPGLRIEELRPHAIAGDQVRCLELARCINAGFTPPGLQPNEQEVEVVLACMRHRRTRTFAAYTDGNESVGGGLLEVVSTQDLTTLDPSWAQHPPMTFAALFSTAIREPWRRRGIQHALLAARLRAAQAAGCAFATISSMPGAGTERNVRRMGFNPACAKLHMVRKA